MSAIELDISGALAKGIGAEHGVTADEWNGCCKRLGPIHASLMERWDRGQLGFTQLPYDTAILDQIVPLAAHVRYRFQNVVVLGIGGSALGLKALARALLNPVEAIPTRMERRAAPRLFVCDNIDPDYFGALLSQLDWRETCINVISKSGKTTEIAAQFMILRDLLEKRFGSQKWKEHVIVTTDPASGPMRAMVICDQLRSFAIPPAIGGRFSVLSAVGLFPAACVGIDVRGLMDGARAMADSVRALTNGGALDEHAVYRCAAALCLLDTKHAKTMQIVMPYAEGLQQLVDWYLQLTAESLGKNGLGQTPVKAIGATDQHAQLQLYMEGPNNKVISLLTVGEFLTKLPIPPSVEPAYAALVGTDLGDLLNIEAEATRRALKEAKRPVIQWRIPRIDPYTIGQLLFAWEWQTCVAAELYGVDPFGQPGVELGKQITREILAARKASP
ncbi:MAG: glucose-6-phosphate isomerase [Deltaproteobacteria bacterium]|nr:glucose-6-phosphate isomerase [Deltaproteobacteria bacterium]